MDDDQEVPGREEGGGIEVQRVGFVGLWIAL